MFAIPKILTHVETVLPYLIVVPFGYFCFSSAFPSLRRQIIQDSKQGLIKSAFVKTWLKEVASDQVILRDVKVRQKSLEFLEALVQKPPVKNEALEAVKRLTRNPNLGLEARTFVFRVCTELYHQPQGLDYMVADLFDFETIYALLFGNS